MARTRTPDRMTVSLALGAIRESVGEVNEVKALYHSKVAERDALIRDAVDNGTPYTRLMAATGLSREALSRIVNRRD